MAVGMMLRRPGGGGIVIDNTYKTLGLSQVITADISAGDDAIVYTLSVSGENVMVAVLCFSLEVSVYVASHSGSSANISFLFRNGAETVKFYVFANPTLGSETYGVKVFDPTTGACVFSNFRKPIRIAGVVPGNTGFSGTPGRIYAPIILTRYDDVSYNNGVIWNIRYSFLRSIGSGIVAAMRTVRTGPIRRTSISGSYLAADVTDY